LAKSFRKGQLVRVIAKPSYWNSNWRAELYQGRIVQVEAHNSYLIKIKPFPDGKFFPTTNINGISFTLVNSKTIEPLTD
jgi:predicted methyltransferase